MDERPLMEEQQVALNRIFSAAGNLHAIWSPPGCGKSSILAVILDAWAKGNSRCDEGLQPIAVVCTGRNKLRLGLLRTLRDRQTLANSVFVIENYKDAMDDPDADVFLRAAKKRKIQSSFSIVLNRLKELDELIDQITLPCSLDLHAQRVKELYTNFLWKKKPGSRSF